LNNCVLVLGGDSTIGSAVAAQLTGLGFRVFKTTRRPASVGGDTFYLDLAKPLDDWDLPKVDVCLLAGAVTSIKLCQEDPQCCELVNVTRTLQVAENIRTQGGYVLLLSTNQVFDGCRPYVTADTPVNPLTIYGAHKARVEAVLSTWKQSAGILRITKVLDKHNALLQSWKTQLSGGQKIQAFDDYFMAPVPLGYAVNVICWMLQNQVDGIMQISGDKDLSYFEAASILADKLGFGDSVEAVSARKSHSLSHVPAYTSLDCSRVKALTTQRCPSSMDAVRQTVTNIVCNDYLNDNHLLSVR
jgi:dTDP-4-dehydrorhamnose reductase